MTVVDVRRIHWNLFIGTAMERGLVKYGRIFVYVLFMSLCMFVVFEVTI